jgi:aminoglycoside 2''-phosphotransferase
MNYMSKINVFIESIREAYPGFILENVRFHPHDGQYNDILIINDELIFRFPKYEESIESFITEIRLLQYMQDHISLQIPQPIYTSLKSEAPKKVFMGYRMIPGEQLHREKLDEIAEESTLQMLADQLACFLKELHGLPTKCLEIDLPLHDGPDKWAELYAEIQAHLFRFIRSDAQAQVSDHFEAYLNNPDLHRYPTCLRHGDFGPSNILYDPETQRISGIIDFSAAGIGDPAVDIAAVSCYSEHFVRRFSSAHPEVESMFERACFYKSTFALQEALHGFRNNDRDAFESGLAEFV